MLIDNRHRGESIAFLSIMLFIISVFLFSNVDTIMTKFGFETKSVVKAQLAKTTEQLSLAVASNASVQKELDLQVKARKAVEADLAKLRATEVVSKGVVSSAKSSLAKKVSAAIHRVDTTKIPSPIGITSYITKDVDEVAKADIESIQLTYKKLFNT